VPPIATNPLAQVLAHLGVATDALSAAFSFATMAGGVPGGAISV
jgi:hypothetical protein